jgi:hypothetical protein
LGWQKISEKFDVVIIDVLPTISMFFLEARGSLEPFPIDLEKRIRFNPNPGGKFQPFYPSFPIIPQGFEQSDQPNFL